MEVVISTSKVNSYGSRVMTAGIETEQYKRNPIVLWMHSRPYGMSESEPLPIGKMTNLRVVEDRLIGTIEFDDKDEFAKKIKSKYESGILNMVSAGLEVVELSDDPNLILPGQRRMTIKRSKLREVSCVDIGANDDSLRLYYVDKMNENAEGIDSIVPLLSDYKNNKKDKEMNEVAKQLNLADKASEREVIDAIVKLQEENKKLKQEREQERERRINAMLDMAINEKRLSKEQRETFALIGKTNGEEVLKNALKELKPAAELPKINDLLKKEKKEEIELSAEMWDKMDREGTLLSLKQSDRETYDKLFAVKFGK